MIALLDTSEDLTVAQSELGCAVEQLLTPLTGFTRQNLDAHFAIDNGAFSGFKVDRFISFLFQMLLEAREEHWKYSTTGDTNLPDGNWH